MSRDTGGDMRVEVTGVEGNAGAPPSRVLVADDDRTTRAMLKAMLSRWRYEVHTASDGLEAWEILRRPNSPRVAVLDWIMPGMDGVDVCRRIRLEVPAEERYIYIILLTAKTSREEIVAGLEAGADDYMVKPFDASELQVRVRIGQRIVNLYSELVAAREALRIQATYDGLTGLLNRAATLDTLHRELSRTAREEAVLGLLMIDIDHFKRVNDTYGHMVGDEVLRACAHRIRASVRRYDAAGRVGGEEFLVILPGADRETVQAVAERIREHIGGAPIETETLQLNITASLGGTTLQGRGVSADELIGAADRALYRAKEEGRNRVVLE